MTTNTHAFHRLHVPGYVPPRLGPLTEMGIALGAGLGVQFVLLLLGIAGHV